MMVYRCRVRHSPSLPTFRILTHGDGARGWKNGKSVIVTSRFMEARRKCRDTGQTIIYRLSLNSPFDEHVYAVWEGGESNADQKRGSRLIVDMMTTVLGNGGQLDFDAAGSASGTASVTIRWVVGLD